MIRNNNKFPRDDSSGKSISKQNVPKTPAEFDYDLWTTADGKCMVRIKRTGEVCEVEREVFRLLRAECINRAGLATCTEKTCHPAGEFLPSHRRRLPEEKRGHIL